MADDMKMGEAKPDGSEGPSGDMLVEAQAEGEETAGEGTGATEHRNGVADVNGGGNDATGDEVSYLFHFRLSQYHVSPQRHPNNVLTPRRTPVSYQSRPKVHPSILCVD